MTSIASGSCGQLTVGTPRLTMPAFSNATFARVPPKTSVWSIPMRAIAQSAGVTTFVASRRPPSPHSTTATSQAVSEKCTKATAHISSNSVGCSPSACSTFAAASRTSSVACRRSGRDTMRPSTWMRSSKCSM